jgi:subtilase family serine protease
VSLGLGSSALASPVHAQASEVMLDPVAIGDVQTGTVCGTGWVHCHAHVHATATGHVQVYATPNGWGPADLQSAYNINPNITTTPIVAIVDAFGYAALEQDLAAYRAQYGLPACTTANGCLKIVNQTGQTAPLPGPPPAGDDWTIETALDVDMVSAACPKCKIVVVQASDDQGDGLFIANNVPSTLGAAAASNSWGAAEQPGSSVVGYETNFNHPGTAVFASSGDYGYNNYAQQVTGPSYPSTSAYAIAVGGTNLQKTAGGRGWAETAWSMGGSSCSLSIPKPSYQDQTTCTYKTATDIAAVADPQTGVAVYHGGWTVVGGTSAASPLVAAIFAATGLTGQASGAFIKQAAAAGKLNDVTTGANGIPSGAQPCPSNSILCHAGIGWDGPTGYGTPNAGMLAANTTGTGSGSGSGSGSDGGSGGGGGTGGNGGTVADQDVTGGCAAGGSGAGLALAFGIGLVAFRRRRR